VVSPLRQRKRSHTPRCHPRSRIDRILRRAPAFTTSSFFFCTAAAAAAAAAFAPRKQRQQRATIELLRRCAEAARGAWRPQQWSVCMCMCMCMCMWTCM